MGEQPLPPNACCLLGSLNLTKFVIDPFTSGARVNYREIRRVTGIAVRLLDNVIDITNYPLELQKQEALNKRRMGIGITGLADMLIMMGIKYTESYDIIERIMSVITNHAYLSSSQLAVEKGSFPAYNKVEYLNSEFLKVLNNEPLTFISKDGIRNSHLISIAPVGTGSLFAGNVSSGLEPVFAYHYNRKIRNTTEDDTDTVEVRDYAYDKFLATLKSDEKMTDQYLPDYFQTIEDLTPKDHMDVQAVIQKYVDSAISKTISCPEDIPFEDFKNIYLYAWEKGLKGITVYRPNSNIESILSKKEEPKEVIPITKEVPKVNDLQLTKRQSVLHGTTYKIKSPSASSSFYVTINDANVHGCIRPYEVFINTKDLNHYSWVVTVSRLLSAILKRETDASFLIKELKSIYDPNGGYFNKGKYIPSISAAMGYILEEHMTELGLIKSDVERIAKPEDTDIKLMDTNNAMSICPMCNEKTLIMESGCKKCLSCMYSACG